MSNKAEINDFDPGAIADALNSLPFKISADDCVKLSGYIDLLKKWNHRYKFTKFESTSEILNKLIIPSIYLGCLIEPDTTLLDIGSGPGIPGIPVKLSLPEIKLTIIESNIKAVEFLSEVKTQIKINSLNTVYGRAEDHARDSELKGMFDTVIVRAFAPVPVVVEVASAFLKLDGILIIQCAGDISSTLASENKSSLKVGMRFDRVGSLKPGFENIAPIFFSIFVKVGEIPPEYPRTWKRIKNAPLWK
ncbi:MAG: 16S rRNA (guanine(527)-N(7))-methyltransferase RsmG [bacterium]|nr:16S rRNA (guanine(527)-N(7))-methyltransferase RsmG [bacterium]